MKHVFTLLCIAFPVLCAAGKPERATTEMSLEELLDKMSVEDSSDSERENLLEPETEIPLKKRIARTALKFCDLTELHITHNNISYDQIRPLLQENFESLQVLNLRCSRIGPRGAKYISGMQLNSLTILDLEINHIGDEGAFHLRKLVAPFLSRICVESNDITPRGSASLVQGNWKKLALLSIHFLLDEVIKSNLQSEGECTLSEMISDGGENIGTHIKAAESLIKVIFAKKEHPYKWEFRK